MKILVREESPSDVDAVFDVTKAAFKDHPHGDETEQFIVNALRRAGALVISLVAEVDGKVVGHIAFSPVTVSDGGGGWFGIGPISVLPELQRRGIGTALVKEGLARLRAMEAKGCVLVGDPAYYRRFGFKSLADLTCDGVPQEAVLALPFGDSVPCGAVTFHDAFSATG